MIRAIQQKAENMSHFGRVAIRIGTGFLLNGGAAVILGLVIGIMAFGNDRAQITRNAEDISELQMRLRSCEAAIMVMEERTQWIQQAMRDSNIKPDRERE